MPISDVEAQMAHVMRGVDEVIHEDELEKLIEKSTAEKRPLRVKLGVDPTASDIHLGHMVTIRKLKHFQDMGHTAIFLLGDFTARVGDPTDRSAGRLRLTKDQVWEHAKTFQDQVFKVLDRDKTEVRNNGEWFDAMTFEDCLDLAYRSTVARMLERNDFEKRYRDGSPISITEFLYPLMQGYDSVALKCDIELGGTDQKFNLLAGRDMQLQFGQPAQCVMMTPLIEGLDGSKKMSKTAGNYVGVDDPPEQMFGKVMSIRDDLLIKYFLLVTDVDRNEVAAYEKALQEVEKHMEAGDPLHPMQIKKALARAVVTEYHGATAAAAGDEYFEKVVQKKETPDDIPVVVFGKSSAPAYEVITTCTTISGSEARRLINQGAVKLDGERVSDPAAEITMTSTEQLLQVGKRKFFHIKTD
jgi:tyrosyl-tRNA synthetase